MYLPDWIFLFLALPSQPKIFQIMRIINHTYMFYNQIFNTTNHPHNHFSFANNFCIYDNKIHL